MSLLALKGTWLKPGEGQGTPVPVTVRGFAQATISDTAGTRPVAIIQEDDGHLRYVELKFVQVEGEVHG